METQPLAAPPPLTDPDTRLVALEGDPLPGVLQVLGRRFTYWRNEGEGRYGGPQPLRDTPILTDVAAQSSQLLDLDGDGAVDLLVSAGSAGLRATTPTARARAGTASSPIRGAIRRLRRSSPAPSGWATWTVTA